VIGEDRLIIVAFNGFHGPVLQKSHAGIGRLRMSGITDITKMIDRATARVGKYRKGITNGIGLPVTVGHDSDQYRHIINTRDANMISFTGLRR